MPDKSDNFSSFVGVLLLLLFLVISIVPFTLFSAEKPDYEVDFDFGSMGINGYIYDTSTDQKIPKEKVSFWALPNSASSPYEVEKIKVEAPGYVPNYVSNFTKRAINLGFKQLVVIELGRVGLTPANSRQLPKITIKSEPSGCAIYVDGAYKGRTPVQRMEMQAGSHEIKLSKRGYNSWTREIYINSGEHRTFYSDEAKLEKKNKPPKADFIYSPYGPSTEETVHFAARAQDPDGRIDSYRWEFGTGDKDWGEEVNYRYERSGDYTVRLLVEDDGGLTNSITKQVSVQEPNKPPSSDFTYSPPEAMPAEIVHFESQASDPDGYISSLVWQFGDGSSSTSKNPDHQYEESGTYTVTLKVKDQSGATDIERKEIKVTFASPKAKFTIKPKKPRTGDQVILDGSGSTVSDGRIESYKWDLDGDGKPESEKSVPKLTYEYTKAGEYSISLTVTDNSGNADSAERTLIVKNKQQEEIEIDEKYGLVIGISKYKDPSLNLKYAAKDAKTFYELLVDEDIGGFQTDKVEILINKEATRDNIDNALKNLVSKTEKNDLVVIYYSGHGSQGPDHNNDEEDGQDEYYITYETDPSSGDAIYKTGYRDDEFADEVKSLDSNQVVIFLDSCYSGGATKSIKGFSLKGQSAPAPGTVFQDFDFEQAEGR
ncbi:PKD domain-containing protein, partial [Candidatus Bipolaricaulota bacterium]|nr:PKD domain-containing protein [Candidatus Bipolaricaulota bacterium]